VPVTKTRILATVGAAAGWLGLVIQLALFVGRFGPALGVWRYLGFFTTLSNIAIAVIATLIAAGHNHWLTGPRPRMMGLVAVLGVALVYSILLRSLWDPQGWDKIVSILLHDVTSALFLLLWLSMPHGALGWRDVPWALTPVAAFLALAMVRYLSDGWVPYYFLDPVQGSAAVAINIGAVLIVYAIVAGAVIAVDARMGAKCRVD
jgi:hypothetical protein